MILPESHNKLAIWSREIVDRCRESVGARAATARAQRMWLYTGSPDGNGSILNMLFPHIERVSSHLYSPAELRFHFDFTHGYPKGILDQAEVAGRVVSREFERRDIDIQFGEGIPVALTYGTCIPKIIDAAGGATCKLCMPWQIGVYREDRDSFSEQEAVCETNQITPFDLWRRISHLPNAYDLFKRAMAYAKRNSGGDEAETWFHQVLIAGQPPVVQTEAPFMTQPGGLTQVTSDPTGAMLSPQVAQEMITLHELWVWNDESEDWTTIQIAEPDILISPRPGGRRKNLFVPGELPYGIIQPNRMPQYFWGRSELADLQKLQQLMRDRLEDIKKVMSLQYDRRLAFSGTESISDEQYDAYLQSGFINLGPGANVQDITPKLPDKAFEDINEILQLFNMVSGLDNILSGQGEPGVRAGNHAQTLMRTASPRFRDRSLILERQVADLAHKVFELLCAKEAKAYWTGDGETENEFLLSQIPEDYRIMVDSHSSSPIYEVDHAQIALALAKLQAIGGEDLIDLLPLPRRDLLKQHLREKQKEQAKLIEEHPELLMQHKGAHR